MGNTITRWSESIEQSKPGSYFRQASLVDERLPNFLRHKKATFTWQPQPPDPERL